MATVELTHDELELIDDVLDDYLADLRMEIADTDDFNFRQGLKKKSEKLQTILSKLEHQKVASNN